MFKLIKFYNRKIKQQKYAFNIYSASSFCDNTRSSVNLTQPTHALDNQLLMCCYLSWDRKSYNNWKVRKRRNEKTTNIIWNYIIIAWLSKNNENDDLVFSKFWKMWTLFPKIWKWKNYQTWFLFHFQFLVKMKNDKTLNAISLLVDFNQGTQ